MACLKFNPVFKQPLLIVILVFLISLASVLALSSEEYLVNDGVAERFVKVTIVKRDTDNISAKKAAYNEKKVKPKESTSTDTSAAEPDDKKAKTSSTTELPDLPSATPTNVTFTNDTNFNNTHHYVYYNASIKEGEPAKLLWIELDENSNATVHPMLSNSHRRAATVGLSFDFPFYGNPIRNITIATGGFLYTGDYMHTWLAATQYIAPLMANFDTSIHNTSLIKYLDTGDSFTVQWENVYLQNNIQDQNSKDNETEDGPFTFQVTLHKNGDIAFVYKLVSSAVPDINNDLHPVKVGLSDAYIMEKAVVFLRRKTIYEYHRADLVNHTIGNDTAIYITALPTCQLFTDCTTCNKSDINFDCVWCESAGRCSNGVDRNRQDWISNHCEGITKSQTKCLAPTVKPEPEIIPTKPTKKLIPSSTEASHETTTPIPASPVSPYSGPTNGTAGGPSTPSTSGFVPPKVVTLPPNKPVNDPAARRAEEHSETDHHKGSVGAGAVISILIIVCLVTAFAIWIIYAYKFPQSPSGQLLIRYRPSQWRWRHGEARYTAASIHI